ncbi:MAG: cation-translocating P-type ATPase [Alphaproteobacteria bacterium]
MAAFHHLSADAVLDRLGSAREGLSEQEAAARLERHGPNRLPQPRGKTLAGVFIAQFKSPFVYLLLIAAAVSLGLGHVTDAAFIAAVLLLNAGVGTYQEWRAETRARALKALIAANVAVWREGRLRRLPSEALVPGDVAQLESGERVPADLRLIEAQNLTADESLLTGESLPARKSAEAAVAENAPLGDRATMLHAGTTVRTGRALAVAVATARETAVGVLAATLERPEPAPPLVRRMARFTRHLAVAMVGLIALFALLEAFRGAAPADIFLLSIALTVAAIPEGLPAAITVALSIAMHRMGLRNVVVRQLPAVEGLGACTLIATDKTGTLTLNRLTVERVWTPGDGELAPDDRRGAPLLTAGAYASEPPAGTGDDLSGDAVDLAFHAAAASHRPAASTALTARIPYEPEKRFGAAFHRARDGLAAYVKGSPETIFGFCADVPRDAATAAERLAAAGYRVLAVAAGPVAAAAEEECTGLRLLGLAALIDPLRPEAKDAVAASRRAGIRVVMITGDHPLTALAIARQLDLASGHFDRKRDEVVTGAGLSRLDGKAFDAAIARASVFARTEPLQKLAIIESLRRQGEIVAVTGDGINDAAALHAADIGVAMGRGGTDVARDASDLILTDDNFASIVAGIEEGRIAYANIRKVILLLLSTGVAEILLMLLATLSGLPPPLSAVQLLWLNLVTNGLQSVALAFERGEPGILEHKPRAAHAPIFDRRMIEQIALGGLTVGLIAFASYKAALAVGVTHVAAQGIVLWVLVWCENAYCLNSRSETRSVFRIPLANNPFLIAAIVGTQLLQVAVLAIPPLRSLLSLDDLTLADGMQLALAGAVVLAVMEAYKLVRPADGPPDRAVNRDIAGTAG